MKRTKEWKQAKTAWFLEYKKTLCCKKCGDKRHYVLEFHHLGSKEDSVAEMMQRGVKIARVKEEIAKCEVLCANCHREFHYLQKQASVAQADRASG